MVALGLFTLLGAAGISVDMGRAQIVQAKLSNALDAAGLAAGSVVNTVDVNSEVTKYFNVNFPPGYMGTTINTLTVSAAYNNSMLTLDAAGTVPTTFMQLFGIESVAVSAHSEITRASKGMELVLVMDTTGSMSQTAGGGVTKINAAKSAANTLLDILYGSNSTIPNLWVGLVPFAQAVNIGPSRDGWTDPVHSATLNWGPTTWMGCVEARTNGALSPKYDITDDPPSVRLFRKYYAPCNANTTYENNRWYGTNASRNNCTPSGAGFGYRSPLNASLGPNYMCSQEVQPMVAQKSTLVTAINNMQARGNTHINLGLAWGWRMLSPRWRGLWGGQMNANNLPLDYNTDLMYKVVILMTDGDNTLSGTDSLGTAVNKSGAYSAFGYPAQNWLSVSPNECTSGGNCTVGENEMDSRTSAVCASMKAQGIIIYTIALGTGISTSSQTMLRNCATKPEFYFPSPTTSQLQTVFQQIGDSLANLRISK